MYNKKSFLTMMFKINKNIEKIICYVHRRRIVKVIKFSKF